MQLVPIARPTLRIAGAEESEFAAALQHLDATAREGSERPLENLAAVCAAAQSALAAVIPVDGALPWPQFAHVMHIDETVQAYYARAGRAMLAPAAHAEPLPKELIVASAQLFREISAVYAREVAQTLPASPAPAEVREPALRFTRALWCLGMSAKWTYFMHQGSDTGLWRTCHALYLRTESLRIAHRTVRPYLDPALGALTCADVYAQTLMLGTLNAGNLSAQQMELAHRWVSDFVRNAAVEASSDGASHVFHACLDSERGLELGTPRGEATAVRFLDIEPICAKLMNSRASLRLGKVDLGEGERQAAVLDYGAFLDLAERFWSPGANEVRERAPRISAKPQAIEVVVGFDHLMQVLTGGPAAKAGARHATDDAAPRTGNITFLHPDAAAEPAATLNCILKDYSDTGVGLILPGGNAAPQLGALIGFRLSQRGRWEAGVLVRQLATPQSDQTLLGIKGISDHPLAVTVRHGKPGAATAAGAPVESPAIFAPSDGRRSRVDSLILRDVAYARSKDFTLPTGSARFHVRLNRVLDRGDGWLRAGFQVLSKK